MGLSKLRRESFALLFFGAAMTPFHGLILLVIFFLGGLGSLDQLASLQLYCLLSCLLSLFPPDIGEMRWSKKHWIRRAKIDLSHG